MSSTIQCGHCGAVLNVPPEAVGRRLKCPRCAQRIEPPAGSVFPKRPPSQPSNGNGRPASSTFIPSESFGNTVDLPMATSSGDLRDTFDLPLMMGDDGAGRGEGGATADAVALFHEQRPTSRRVTGGDARKQARRCPTCGGYVPQGMSLCGTCGFDLDTGVRVGLGDDLLPISAPRRSGALPIGIGVVGGVTLIGSIGLTAVALVQWRGGLDGAQYLALVCLFGIYAAAQFLRGKTARLLIVALTLGVMFDVVALIALPIYDAQNQATSITAVHNPGEEEETGETAPISEFLNTRKLGWGVALILSYATVAAYLNSPPVRRHFERI